MTKLRCWLSAIQIIDQAVTQIVLSFRSSGLESVLQVERSVFSSSSTGYDFFFFFFFFLSRSLCDANQTGGSDNKCFHRRQESVFAYTLDFKHAVLFYYERLVTQGEEEKACSLVTIKCTLLIRLFCFVFFLSCFVFLVSNRNDHISPQTSHPCLWTLTF